jgi:RNA 3'-phosphate cyclase
MDNFKVNPTPDHGYDPWKIDGSEGEGGGQILRLSLACAAILSGGRIIEVENIRAGRSNPGLSSQHLECIHVVQGLCSCVAKGDHGEYPRKGDKVLRLETDFYRTLNLKANYLVDIKTAGAISLVIQASLPALIYIDAESLEKNKKSVMMVLKGGTHVPFSPTIEHVKYVLFPLLRSQCGVNLNIDLKKYGFYPEGGGQVVLTMGNSHRKGALKPIVLTKQGKIVKIRAILYGIVPEKPTFQSRIRFYAEDQLVERFGKESERSVSVNIDCTLPLDGNELDETPAQVKRNMGGLGINSDGVAVGGKGHGKRRRWKPFSSSKGRGDGGRGRGRGGHGGRGYVPSPQAPTHQVTHPPHGEKDGLQTIGEVRNGSGSSRRGKSYTLGCDIIVYTDTGAILHANDLRTEKVLEGKLLNAMILGCFVRIDDMLKSGACVDEHTADQLLLYMAAAKGRSEIVIPPESYDYSTKHVETAMSIIEKLVVFKSMEIKFKMTTLKSGARKIEVYEGANISCCDDDRRLRDEIRAEDIARQEDDGDDIGEWEQLRRTIHKYHTGEDPDGKETYKGASNI